VIAEKTKVTVAGVYYRLGAMGILQPKRLVITFFQQMFSKSSAVGTALLANRLRVF
jgi:hypothetical protein